MSNHVVVEKGQILAHYRVRTTVFRLCDLNPSPSKTVEEIRSRGPTDSAFRTAVGNAVWFFDVSFVTLSIETVGLLEDIGSA